MSMTRARDGQSGYIALMAVLVLGAAALAISLSLLTVGADSQRMTLVSQQGIQAQNLARHCGEEALLQIHDNVAFTTSAAGTTLNVGQGTCNYRVTQLSAASRVVQATGTVNGVVRRIQALATVGVSTITTSAWTDDDTTHPAIAYVQSVTNMNDATGTTLSQAFRAPVTAGNLIVAAVSWDSTGSAGTLTCSDNLGNSYTTMTVWNDASTLQTLAVCYAPNITGGSATVTATLSATHITRRMVVSEYSGVATSNPVDVSAGVNGTAGSTAANAITSGSITPTLDGDLIYGATMDTGGVTTIAPGTGFTQRNFINLKDLTVQDQIQTTATPVASTMTFGTAHRYVATVIAFKAATY